MALLEEDMDGPSLLIELCFDKVCSKDDQETFASWKETLQIVR